MRRVFWIGAASLLGLAALVSIVALLRGEFTDTDGRILGTLAILTVLAWFLVPVLGRIAAESLERVVGRGPGRVEVDLAEGETLVVRR